jgi:hypothetical protein
MSLKRVSVEVDPRGFEPLTFWLPARTAQTVCSPGKTQVRAERNCACYRLKWLPLSGTVVLESVKIGPGRCETGEQDPRPPQGSTMSPDRG